jgi:hypothetical protein
MSAYAKTQQLLKQLSASNNIIDELVKENYELKCKLQEIVSRQENVGRNSAPAE